MKKEKIRLRELSEAKHVSVFSNNSLLIQIQFLDEARRVYASSVYLAFLDVLGVIGKYF